MSLRLDALHRVTCHLPCGSFGTPGCRRLIGVGWALWIWMLVGCASIAPQDGGVAFELPQAETAETIRFTTFRISNTSDSSDSFKVSGVSAPTSSTNDWATESRKGREALLESDFKSAEALLLSALDGSKAFRSRDVRVDVSFGNLVRLASVYERIGRRDDAKRLMMLLESTAGQRRVAARGIARYKARYETLVASALGRRLEPVSRPKRGARKASAPYDRLIRYTADSFDVDPALVKAVVAAES